MEHELIVKQLIETLEELIDAAQSVVASWENGDLAGAVNEMMFLLPDARDTVSKAKKKRKS